MTVMRESSIPTSSAPEERALRKASMAALRTGTLPATFRAMVKRRETEVQGYRRVAYRIERRTIALQVTPAPGVRADDLRAPPVPAAVDPWGVEPSTLRSSTEVNCTCIACAGAKKVPCPICAAAGQIRCGECGGGGKVSGQRGPKNCPSCRGRGTAKCGSCKKGMMKCGPCDGAGRVRAWLEVHAQHLVQVLVHPETGVAELHERRSSVEDLDLPPVNFRVPLVQDSGWMPALPGRLAPELSPALDAVSDRVTYQRIQRFESNVYKFTYATRGSEGVVSVSGDPPAVLPGGIWGPLWRRSALAVASGLVVLIVGGVVNAAYVERAEWFRTQGNAGPIAFVALVAAIAAATIVAGLCMPPSARRPLQRSPAVWTFSSACLLIAVLWNVGGPTIAAAESAIDRGDLAAAQAELAAVEFVEGSSERLAVGRSRLVAAEVQVQKQRDLEADQRHLAEVHDASSAEAALGRANNIPWKTGELELQGRAVALQRARDDLGRRVQADDSAALVSLASSLAAVDPALAEQATARAHLARASAAIKRGEFTEGLAALEGWTGDADALARRSELRNTLEVTLRQALDGADLTSGDLDAQREAIDRALSRARLFEALTHTRANHTSESLRSRLAQVEAAIERDRKKAAAVEQKRIAAETRAQKKAEAAERRRLAAEASAAARNARISDRVRCCDGSLSPSCNYSQGSLRGCCSHHDGVC